MRNAASYLLGLLVCVLLASYMPTEHDGSKPSAVFQTATSHLSLYDHSNPDNLFQKERADIIRWTIEANSVSYTETSVRITAPCKQTESTQRIGSGRFNIAFQGIRDLYYPKQQAYLKKMSRPHALVTKRSTDYHIYALRHLLI